MRHRAGMLGLIAHECASLGNPSLYAVAYRRRAPFKSFDRARHPRLERIDRFTCMLFQIQRRSLRFVQAMRKAVLGFVSCARQGFAGALNLAKVLPFLEADDEMARRFFARLRAIQVLKALGVNSRLSNWTICPGESLPPSCSIVSFNAWRERLISCSIWSVSVMTEGAP